MKVFSSSSKHPTAAFLSDISVICHRFSNKNSEVKQWVAVSLEARDGITFELFSLNGHVRCRR